MKNSLYIVATPIGNLDDITFRAVEILKTVDLILAEDTRHSQHLLAHFDILTPMRAFHEHNESQQTASVIAQLLSGKNIALISDAGTPLISDPGYQLVFSAKKAGVNVSPIPGASAVISALSAAGIASHNFGFFGFLPAKQSARLKAIRALAFSAQTVIFYESPRRILACAQDLLNVLGAARVVCFAKEISKSFETIKTDTLPNLIAYLQADITHQKGEFVVLISPVDTSKIDKNAAELSRILLILLAEMSCAKAAKLAAKLTGSDKQVCYQHAISLQHNSPENA